MVQDDVRVAGQQRRRHAFPEAQRVDRPLRVPTAGDGDEHRAGQPGDLRGRRKMGEGSVAGPYEHGRIRPAWVAVGEPRRQRREVDVAEPGRVDALGGADARVDPAQQPPRQPAGHPDGSGGDRAGAEVGERLAAQGGGQRGVQHGGRVERCDDVAGVEVAHRRSSATVSPKRLASR
jgi:hypothetical protein